MKKTLLTILVMLSLCLSARAVEYVDWVKWDQIQHWAGDPAGEKKCALVIDFQDEYDSRALVWGYRWNGTATGEDMIRAIAGQSSCLTAMVQYTGSMGSTLNGLGISTGRDNLNHLHYDFDRAAIGGEVSFGFFEPNTSMGQETAPGYEAEQMCKNAIERAKTTGIIEHPLNAFAYGYPAYDYDYWQLEEGSESVDCRWRAGWYDGYWSYWHGPNDYDCMGYSGLGMSSVVLTDGSVQAWKYVLFNGEGGIGSTGDDLARELNYGMTDYSEQMHAAAEVVQPVDQAKVGFWVGEGEKSATVVFQFNDGRGPENLVYGYRWSGGWDDNLNTVLTAIAAADPRMTLTKNGDAYTVTYDSDCNGELGSNDHTDVENTWYCYVKRTVDEGFSCVPADRYLNPNAVMVFSHQSDATASVELPYLLYRPALDSENIITMPESVEYALADQTLTLPLFIQIPEGGKMGTAFSWTPSADVKSVVTSWGTTNFMGKANGFKNFKPTEGTVKVRGSYTAPGQTKSTYVYSNDVNLTLNNPVRPITSISYASASVEARLNHEVDNELVFEPADATYTKISYTSSATKVATVNSTTGVVKTTKVAGEATITASYALDAGITSQFQLASSLVNPVEDVTFECADEDNVITLTPKEMAGLFPIFTPEDPDITDVTVAISGNGDSKDNYIATMYQVNIWDENNNRTRPYELSGHRVGECKLTVSSQDGTDFVKEFTIRVVESERETAIDYNTGTIMLNEEWYGHTNGGLNWFSPEYDVVYQAYERENPGMSFGATSQYGIVYDGKLIVCSKQAVDNGDPLPGGGRVVIADAATLKRLGSIDNLMWGNETRSNDGRACVGAGHGKAYIGSNSGIYIVDTEKFEIIGKVGESTLDGEDNGKPNTDPTSSLYSGQMGDMVLAGNHVFAIRQSAGVYVIDIDTDKIVKYIADSQVQGITQSADGHVWYATIVDKLSNFVALDQNTFEEIDRVVVPAEIGTVTCGWGAWRTTQFTGAQSVNALFFSPGSSISNGGAGLITRYDIDEDKFTSLAKVSGLPAHTPGLVQGAYGTIRYDDRTGEIIAGTTESKASGHYRWNWTHFINAKTGEIVRSIELRPYYWFQAHAIFPDAFDPEVEDIDDIVLDIEDAPLELTINATDRDNNDANIRLSLIQPAEAGTAVSAALEGNKLTLTPLAVGQQTIGLAVESNGKVVDHAVNVTVVDKAAGIGDVDAQTGRIFTENENIIINGYAGVEFRVVNIAGRVVDEFTCDGSSYSRSTSLAAGVYVVMGDNGVAKKIIIK